MPALVAGIHISLSFLGTEDVDGRVKPGHDGGVYVAIARKSGRPAARC